jgi:hypothetical protein
MNFKANSFGLSDFDCRCFLLEIIPVEDVCLYSLFSIELICLYCMVYSHLSELMEGQGRAKQKNVDQGSPPGCLWKCFRVPVRTFVGS